MSKILFLGHEGSGKTVLMTMLSRYFETAGDGRWGLDPQTEAAFTFMEQAPAKIAEGKWPQQTTVDKIITYRWELQYAGNGYTTLEMLEYPGEVFRHLFDESAPNKARYQEECAILSTAIHEAESIFLLINLEDLKNTSENRKNVQTVWQLCQVMKYLTSLGTQPRITLVLTQIDRYCDDPENVNPTNLLLSQNSLFLKRGFQNYNIIVISAVGKTIKDDHGNDVPDIQNTHPYGLSRLIYNFLQGTPVEREIDYLIEAYSLLNREVNKSHATSQSCNRSIKTIDAQIRIIVPLLQKYGYLLEDNIRLNTEKSLRIGNETKERLGKLYTTLSQKEAEERKRQEEEHKRKAEEERRRQEQRRREEEKRRQEEEEWRRQKEAEARARELHEREMRRRQEEERKTFRSARICFWCSFIGLLLTIMLVSIFA